MTVHTLAQQCYRQCTEKQASWLDSIGDVIRRLAMPVINKDVQDAADMIIVQAYVAARKTLVWEQDRQLLGQSSCEITLSSSGLLMRLMLIVISGSVPISTCRRKIIFYLMS